MEALYNMNRIEFLRNLDKYKGEDHSVFLEHYGILGQKWGQRRWQNADGTFNEAGKERYFGKSSKTNISEEKIGSKTSDVKDYLKLRNKLLKERTRPDLYEWYRDKNKYLDKQLVRDAKRMDKAAKKMYENQLKDFYDNPNDLVADLKSMYRIGGKAGEKNKYQNPDGTLTKKGEKLLAKARSGNEKAKAMIDGQIDIDAWNKVRPDSIEVKNMGLGLYFTDKKDKNVFNDKLGPTKYKSFPVDFSEIVGKKNLPIAQAHRDEIETIFDKLTGTTREEIEEGRRLLDNIKDPKEKDVVSECVGTMMVSMDHFTKPGEAFEFRFKGQPDQKLAGIFTKTPEEKEAKRLTKEAKDIEKSFIEKWNGQEYYNSKEIDKWLDKDENKKLEEVYADCMKTAFGDTSEKLKKVFKDYDDDEVGYVSKAAICDALQDTKKLGDLGSEVYWFLTDDGNQGERNSEAYYLNEKGYDRKQIGDMYREAANNLNEGYEVGMRLSQYMNPTVPYLSDRGKKELYQQVNYRWEGKDNYTFNKILEASEGGDFNKNNINAAKNIAKKMAPSCSGKDNTGWFYFNQAVRNLGMTDTDYTDLSSADWNKINAEINKLKK